VPFAQQPFLFLPDEDRCKLELPDPIWFSLSTALGKKNWLFVGHPEAGERSAIIYTLLGSCRRHGLNPIDYLKDLFTRLPAAKITEIKEFTPTAWAKAKEKVFAPAA